jgi:hypothetical protein
MSFFDNFKGQNGADIASLLGSFSSGKKADRSVEGNFTQNYDQMMLGQQNDYNSQMLRAAQDRNANEMDALKKLQITSYLKGGGAQQGPMSIMLSGQKRELPSFNFGPKAASAEEMAGASTLQDTIMSRFGEDGSYVPTNAYQPTALDKYAKPGMEEKISSYGGAGVGILSKLMGGGGSNPLSGVMGSSTGADDAIMGGLASKFGAGSGVVNAGGTGGYGFGLGTSVQNPTVGGGAISNLLGGTAGKVAGKALPIAGAVTGGLGLLKDRGLGGNVMNGITAGSSIGSMIAPGIGTAIGAGAGALIGGLRSIGGGPSEAEKAGRTAAAQGRQSIISMATPEQRAATGGDVNNLAMVVIRDALVKKGQSPDMAGAFLDALFKAEKQGPEAVAQTLSSIQNAIGATPQGSNGAQARPGVYRG